MIQIGEKPQGPLVFALWASGFRPFFMGAMGFAVLAISLWAAVYSLGLPVDLQGISSFQWHSHEMLYGYAMAVVAGFLLTAVGNWTGRPGLRSTLLMGLFLLWLAARLLFFAGTQFIQIVAILDLSFGILLTVAVAVPVFQEKQWKQVGILSKLLLMWLGNLAFYLGALGYLDDGVRWGVYGGLYLVIGLVLMMARRVVPFFIERGVGYRVELRNSQIIDVAGLVLFVVFFVAELSAPLNALGGYIAGLLLVLNLVRLIGWHTSGIWSRPLLWGLFLALIFIDLGFLLHTLAVFTGLSPYLAIHAFAYGGIGMITMSMMGRVTLGHTGREVQEPPRLMGVTLMLLTLGALLRVFFPLIAPEFSVAWIISSQLLWILAFGILLWVCAPMLWRSRIDGRPG